MLKKIRRKVALFVWVFSYIPVFILVKIFASREVYCEDKRFKGVKRPIIVVSNHKGFFDPWIIFSSLPFRVFLRLLPIRPFAKTKFREKGIFIGALSSLGILRFVYFIYDVITIPDVDSFDEKIKPLVKALEEQGTILMFPEGRIISGDEVGEFKKGAAAIQMITGVPILPCAVRYKKKFLFRHRIVVSFGSPVFLWNKDGLRTGAKKRKPQKSFDEKEREKALERLRQEVIRLYSIKKDRTQYLNK